MLDRPNAGDVAGTAKVVEQVYASAFVDCFSDETLRTRYILLTLAGVLLFQSFGLIVEDKNVAFVVLGFAFKTTDGLQFVLGSLVIFLPLFLLYGATLNGACGEFAIRFQKRYLGGKF